MKKISYDYSSLIPKAHPGIRLPDVYTKDEILKLEASVDRSKPEGKRDYAVIIVASRLNLRNSDIAGLLFDAVDFVNNSISICQKKTNGKLQLPLLPEVKAALNDYINNARPQSNEPFIFLRTKAPYTRLQDATIYAIVRKALNASGIKNKGRRQGAQALRASGATNKVNSDVPYSLVRKSLGHQSENAIQHYASLDVEHLRKCALEPPPITKGSSFEIFLKGDTITCK